MAVVNSSEVYVRISTDGGNTFSIIAASTEAALDTSHSVRDVTNKYSGGSRALGDGKREWNVSGGGWVVYDGDGTPIDITALLTDRAQFFTEVVGGTSQGAMMLLGMAYITAQSEGGGTEDTVTYSVSLSGRGILGYSWGDYMAQRVDVRGGTAENIQCVDNAIHALRQVSVS